MNIVSVELRERKKSTLTEDRVLRVNIQVQSNENLS